jgi:hypothetical protein
MANRLIAKTVAELVEGCGLDFRLFQQPASPAIPWLNFLI